MTQNRRLLLRAAVGATAVSALAPLAWAQSAQPIKILVGFPPGADRMRLRACWPTSSRTSWAV